MLRASIDLMGGDNAPEAILSAAFKVKNVHFIFVGLAYTEELIKKYNIAHYTFVDASVALEEGKRFSNADLENSSMYIAIEQVKQGNADYIVSAGPSGYYLLLARRILGTLANLNRPALAAIIPTATGSAVMLDLGANITCDAVDLVKFGVMGTALAKVWLGVDNPKVGFVNVGSELGKGPDYIKNALDQFKKLSIQAEASFAEGHELLKGDYDVIVADGFVGNCLLKFGEGLMAYVKIMLKQAFSKGISSKILGLLLRKKIKTALIDPKKFNGGVFAGINGCVIKSHGRSDDISFESAIRIGMKIGKNKAELLNTIEKDLLACDMQSVE